MARERKPINVQIMQVLTEYTAEMGKAINAEGEKLAKAALKDLRAKSPKDTGVYAKSWKLKKFGKYGTFRIVLYNSQKYRLTSILEHGFKHQPDGKHIEGREHIKPVQDKLNRDFEKAVETIIKNL